MRVIGGILLGLVLAIAICVLTPFNNSYLQGTPLGGGHFPLAPFFVLVWLTVIIGIARKIFNRQIWLTGKELLVSWILMVLASGIAFTGLVRTFFINLTAPLYFATVENRWGEVLLPLLPKAWYPQNSRAVEDLYFIHGDLTGENSVATDEQVCSTGNVGAKGDGKALGKGTIYVKGDHIR